MRAAGTDLTQTWDSSNVGTDSSRYNRVNQLRMRRGKGFEERGDKREYHHWTQNPEQDFYHKFQWKVSTPSCHKYYADLHVYASSIEHETVFSPPASQVSQKVHISMVVSCIPDEPQVASSPNQPPDSKRGRSCSTESDNAAADPDTKPAIGLLTAQQDRIKYLLVCYLSGDIEGLYSDQ
jgi:hypothetical protein